MENGNKLLGNGDFKSALQYFSEMLDNNPDHLNAQCGYRIANFWFNRLDILHKKAKDEKYIEQLMNQWEVFEDYTDKYDLQTSEVYPGILRFMHRQVSSILPFLTSEQRSLENQHGILTKIGEIFLQEKDWDYAIQALEAARTLRKDDALILAYLGEAYYQADNNHRAMVMLREAFFINPERIPLHLLNNTPTQKILAEMKESGIKNQDLAEWLPVFGALLGVFTVKRSLSNSQLQDLNRNTMNLEEAYRNNSDHSKILPRLLNHYLWLLDYFFIQDKNNMAISEIVSRVKSLDERVYELLFSTYGLNNH